MRAASTPLGGCGWRPRVHSRGRGLDGLRAISARAASRCRRGRQPTGRAGWSADSGARTGPALANGQFDRRRAAAQRFPAGRASRGGLPRRRLASGLLHPVSLAAHAADAQRSGMADSRPPEPPAHGAAEQPAGWPADNGDGWRDRDVRVSEPGDPV
ncbi:MAG: hypothetical protein AMS21_04070 [Gemmatimonas sp. SG8_38_2]|nr:MAG: hypothetical protein AMS21_04070 [Gemmatimonas sp. SG8_38_2]